MKKIILPIIIILSLFLRIYKLNFSGLPSGEVTVRLLSALAGVFAVWLLYLFITNGLSKNIDRSGNIALAGALLLAINPWHLNFSRGNWESSLTLTGILAIIVCLQSFVKNNNENWSFGGLTVIILALASSVFISSNSHPTFITHSLLSTYFNHFSGRFLFIGGDWQNLSQGVIYHGLFYLIDAVFMVIGLWFIIRNGLKPFDRFMLLWLLLAPLPSVLSGNSVSSVLTFTMVIPLVFLTANGLLSLPKLITNRRLLITLSCFLFLAYCFSFVRFADLYLIHNPLNH